MLLLPDEHNLTVCHLLASSASLLLEVHQRQTTSTQLLVRVSDPSYEPRCIEEASPTGFRVTPIVEHAAMPNLIAEVLHPQCHWSHTLDNALPATTGGEGREAADE